MPQGGGWHPRSRRPATAPTIHVKARNSEQIEVRLREQGSSRRGKPEGVWYADVRIAFGKQPPADPAQWRFMEHVSRTNAVVKIPPNIPAGQLVWATARWVSTLAEAGPFGAPDYTMVPLGGCGPGHWIGNELEAA